MDYKELLEHSFTMEKEHSHCGPESRLEFLSRYVFDFTTYDGSMDVLFATKAVEVCAEITKGTTLEYTTSRESYEWFLIMCNMPFFSERIDWGTKITCPWWTITSDVDFKSDNLDLWVVGLQFDVNEWEQFIHAVVEFASPEMPTSTN